MARARLAPDYSNPGPILKLPLSDGSTPVPLKFSFVVFVVCWTRPMSMPRSPELMRVSSWLTNAPPQVVQSSWEIWQFGCCCSNVAN